MPNWHERERLARLIAEEEGVTWGKPGGDGLADRRELMGRASELEDVSEAELRALARFLAGGSVDNSSAIAGGQTADTQG